MKRVFFAVLSFVVSFGVALSSASADDDYTLSIVLLGGDGGVVSHQHLKCPLHAPCVANYPATIQGKTLTISMKLQVHDDHQIGVMIFPPAPTDANASPPFNMLSTFRTFELGNEWTLDLKRDFIVPVDPSKQKFKWINTQLETRTVLKIRMKLDS